MRYGWFVWNTYVANWWEQDIAEGQFRHIKHHVNLLLLLLSFKTSNWLSGIIWRFPVQHNQNYSPSILSWILTLPSGGLLEKLGIMFSHILFLKLQPLWTTIQGHYNQPHNANPYWLIRYQEIIAVIGYMKLSNLTM